MGRQRVVQPLDLGEGNVGAGRIVRIGEEDDLGLRRHRGENRVDVRREIGLRRDHRLGAGRERGDRIDQKAVGGVDRFVAVGEIGAGQQVQQVVGAGAADDAVRIEPERPPDRFAQFARRAVRIIFKMRADGLISRDGARARSEWRLVRRQLVYLGDAGRAALAGHVGLDVEHAGAGLGARHSHRKSLVFRIRLPAKRGGNLRFRRHRIAGRVAADEGCERIEAPLCRSAAATASMPPPGPKRAKRRRRRRGPAPRSRRRQPGEALDRRRAPARHPHAPYFGLGHHGVGGDARNDEHRQAGRMIGALDERQPRDDFRRAREFERRPPRSGAGNGERRARGRGRLWTR